MQQTTSNTNDQTKGGFDDVALRADVRAIIQAAKGRPDPIDELYSVEKKPRILARGTPEWDQRQKEEKEWMEANLPPAAPPPPYHVNKDGAWEMRCISEPEEAARRVANNEPDPGNVFKVVVDQQRMKWALKEGPRVYRYLDSGQVVSFLRARTRGEKGRVEYYTTPTQIDEWMGDSFGDYINSESW